MASWGRQPIDSHKQQKDTEMAKGKGKGEAKGGNQHLSDVHQQRETAKEWDEDQYEYPYPAADEAVDKSAEKSLPVPQELLTLNNLDLETFAEELSTAVEDPDPNQSTDLDWAWKNLPVSPLMDPGFTIAREKWQIPKRHSRSKTKTIFQLRLEKNPYAIALATPVRRCQMTKVCLPRFFMQNFGILGHPTTGHPHFIPRGMYTSRGEDSKQIKQIQGWIAPEKDDVQPGTDYFEAKASRPTQQPPPLQAQSKEPVETGPGMYTLSRYPVLAAMLSKHGGFGTDPLQNLVPSRLKSRASALAVFNKAEFRSDMPDFVLELARKRIVQLMIFLHGRRAGYITAWDNWDDAKHRTQTGAYLWTGEDGSPDPPEFATIDVSNNGREKKIPVYNLKVLLGQEKLNELRDQLSPALMRARPSEDGSAELKKRGTFDAPIIAINHRNHTVHLQVQLWWLQGYCAQHGKFLGSDDKNV